MKATILAAIFLLSISASAQTTTELYTYITKGYVNTLQNGYDQKKGYSFLEIIKGAPFTGTISSNTYQFSYRGFYADDNKNHIIAYMIVLYKNDAIDKVFCLPSSGSSNDLYLAFFKDADTRLYEDQKAVMYKELTKLLTIVTKAAEACAGKK